MELQQQKEKKLEELFIHALLPCLPTLVTEVGGITETLL
jgi:hypothetical protein